jgi:hypothetical protein
VKCTGPEQNYVALVTQFHVAFILHFNYSPVTTNNMVRRLSVMLAIHSLLFDDMYFRESHYRVRVGNFIHHNDFFCFNYLLNCFKGVYFATAVGQGRLHSPLVVKCKL